MDSTVTPYGRTAAGNVSHHMQRMWAEIPQHHRDEIVAHLWIAVTGLIKRGIDLAKSAVEKLLAKIREWLGLDSPVTAVA